MSILGNIQRARMVSSLPVLSKLFTTIARYDSILCSVFVKVGGLARGRASEGADSSENSVNMNVYSDEACAFAEQVLKAGVDVEFEYSEDYVEVWDLASRILHKMTILN